MTDPSSRTILVTGATAGHGRYVAGELAASGAHVVVHGRDPAKVARVTAKLAEPAGGRGRVTGVVADFADLDDVDRLADELLGRLDRLDVVVNNAGIGFGPPGGGRETSAQGLELRFAVNYLAGVLLTRRLLRLVQSSAPARIVNVASIGQVPIDLDDLQIDHGYAGIVAYRRSKLAQIMFTFDLAAALDPAQVTVNALHPATFMDTSLVRDAGGQPLSSVAQGAAATLRLIEDPALAGVTGRFFDGTREARADDQAYDPQVRARLRTATDRLLAAARQAADRSPADEPDEAGPV
jgi:NAD(P)-dependent dehydrogenase (short-subunit alcohol dehydrogenase family)